jgi:hypothetical protein
MAIETFTPDLPSAILMSVFFDAAGVGWLPLDQASELMIKIAQPDSTVPGLVEAVEKLKNAIKKRIELGDATVGQLLNAAERAAPSDRDHLRELAIDRARGDYAVASADRRATLVAWGEALLARSRRGPWQSAKPFAEHAKEIFEMAGRP